MIISGVVLLLAAIVIVSVAEAAARGRLGINNFVGIRFGSLMVSERAWQEGHRAARVPLILAGLALFAAGLVTVTGALSENESGTVVLVAAIVAVALIAVAAFIAKRAADNVLIEDSEQ